MALELVDAEVILDLTALSAMSLVPDLWTAVVGLVSRVVFVRSQVDEIRTLGRQSLPSGYVRRTSDGVSMSEVTESDQAAIAARGRWMVGRTSDSAIEEPVLIEPITRIPDLEAQGAWAHALHLAKATGRPLVADDPALLDLARASDVKTSGTLALLYAGRAVDRVSELQVQSLLTQMVEKRFVDVPLDPLETAVVLSQLSWGLGPTVRQLSRAEFWRRPNCIAAHRNICEGIGGTDRSGLAPVAHATAIGLQRAMPEHAAGGFVALLVIQLVDSAQVGPTELPEIVDAMRHPFTDSRTELLPQFVKSFVELRAQVQPRSDAATFVSRLCGELNDEDRRVVTEALL